MTTQVYAFSWRFIARWDVVSRKPQDVNTASVLSFLVLPFGPIALRSGTQGRDGMKHGRLQIARLQESFEQDAGPYLDRVQDRFHEVRVSLGLASWRA